MMRLRPWDGRADTKAVQRLASRLWPHGSHPGGLGWEAATDQLPAEKVLAEDDAIVGWAGVTGGELIVQADPASRAVAAALLDWAIAAAREVDLTVQVPDGAEMLRTVVTEAGFVLRPDTEPLVGMFRRASREGPRLPGGYRVRGIGDAEATERVRVHRAAWRPATMPWPAGTAPVSADATSRFTAAHFEQVRRTWLYDPALDLVIEAPDGSLAACCTAWWDPAISCAEIEPLGVVPEHRRKGLASALCMEVAAQIAARGGDQVFINVGPRRDYPAPAATYVTVGFAAIPRGRVYYRPELPTPPEGEVGQWCATEGVDYHNRQCPDPLRAADLARWPALDVDQRRGLETGLNRRSGNDQSAAALA
jgi:GNAT superfamily N-acetyltransferase